MKPAWNIGQLAAARVFARPLRRREDGGNLLETALLMPVLMLMLVAAVDYGRGFYMAIEVASAAEAGALYGTLNYTDTAGMAAMARLDARDVPGMTATAVYGCECSDGTSFSAGCAVALTCSANVVQYVEVSTAAAYVPILRYPGLPSSFALKGKTRLRTGQ